MASSLLRIWEIFYRFDAETLVCFDTYFFLKSFSIEPLSQQQVSWFSFLESPAPGFTNLGQSFSRRVFNRF
jgi:hypothetical protein